MLTSLFAFFLPDWRDLTVGIGILSAFYVFLTPFYPKSPMFLYNKGKEIEGRKILKTFAKKTKTDLPDEFLDGFEIQLRKERDDVDRFLTFTT